MHDNIKPEHFFRDQLLQVMIDNNWSDLYLTVGTFPSIKIAWEIVKIDSWL